MITFPDGSDLNGIRVTSGDDPGRVFRVGLNGVSESGYRIPEAGVPVPNCARMGIPKEWYIPKKERIEIWKEREAKKMRNLDLMRRFKVWLNQSPTSQCWSFAVAHAVTIRFLQMGLKADAANPTFIANIVNGYVDQGGWGDNALEAGAKYGWPTMTEMPELNIFGRKAREVIERVKPLAVKRRTTEWILCPGDWDGKMSLMARTGFPVYAGYGKIGHETCSIDGGVDSRGNEVCIDQDSYTNDGFPDPVIRTESFGAGEDQGCPMVIDAAN